MTVADLIRELQAMPNQNAPVMVCIDVSSVDDTGADFEWSDVDRVVHEGPYVALEHR